MTLASERLIYTQVTFAEKENYMRWYTDDVVMRHITGTGLTKEQAEARFAKTLKTNETYPNMGFYTAKNQASREFVGIAKFTYLDEAQTQVEVGYGMMPEYWGAGYATEMLCCLMKHAQAFPNIKELIGIVNPENDASVKVLTKQGFALYKATFGENPAEYYKLELKQA
ncbi:MAG TPA: hypothetical protein DCS93_14700 [Microscillaceae bacterium]|nr:hypothetical protein [Microscillaceae bacterium]